MLVLQGNSLQDNGYTRDINKICHGIERWGQVVLKRSFHNTGKSLKIGHQNDTNSCGICVVNCIEHHMFGAPLFTDGEQNSLCVHYFTRAVKLLVNEVSR